jgi:hypothetical protein|tara:strand:+ start:1267 stop:1446 length:180 start_codon:yes stop_codon:yes gene_type:complete
MIGYAFIEEEEPPTPEQVKKVSKPVNRSDPKGLEDTECNYLVLFFILGVALLAATDRLQ